LKESLLILDRYVGAFKKKKMNFTNKNDKNNINSEKKSYERDNMNSIFIVIEETLARETQQTEQIKLLLTKGETEIFMASGM
jgi:hypothetical protein